MGIFSSKYVTHVGTSVSRVIADDHLPDSLNQGLINAIFQEEELISSILYSAATSIAITADRLYTYGTSGYVFGCPSGSYRSNSEGGEEIEAILTGLEGTPVVMEYHMFGPPNILHIGWKKLISEYGYDPATNKIAALSVLKDADVYLHDIEVVIPAALKSTYSSGAMVQNGTAACQGVSPTRPATMIPPHVAVPKYPSPVVFDTAATEDYAKVTYAWQVTTTVNDVTTTTVMQETLNITNAEYSETVDFYQAKYSVGGVDKYWIYQSGTGTYPVLDSLFSSTATAAGSYFPFIPFRHNKQSMGADTTTAQYKSLVHAAKQLGVPYAKVLEAIESNADIGDVEQAYMTLAVPAVTTNQVEAKYLFDFFDQMRSNNPEPESTVPTLQDFQSWTKKDSSRIAVTIQDTLVKTQLTMSGIYKRRLSGNVGAVGTHTASFEAGLLADSQVFTSPQHIYRKQITANLYDEIRVAYLEMRYQVWGEYATTVGEESPILLVPLDRSITSEYPFRAKEELYSRSLHIVCNARVIQKVKWYQQEWFGIFLKIVAVVIFIWSLGSASSASDVLWTIAELAGSYAAAAYLFNLLAAYLIKAAIAIYATRKLTQELGIEFTLVLAIVLAAVGITNGGGTIEATTSTTLLQASNNLMQAVSKETQDALADIWREMQTLESAYLEKEELLVDARKLLEVTHSLSPVMLFGEAPSDYYLRTVHSGNVGTIAIEAVHSYVDIALTLPTLSQTLGEFQNG